MAGDRVSTWPARTDAQSGRWLQLLDTAAALPADTAGVVVDGADGHAAVGR